MHGKFGGDAAEEVGAGLIGKVRNSRIGKGLLDHARGRGLAVGARDNHRGHVLCQMAQHVGAELQGHPAREVRAPPAQQPDGKPAEFAGENREQYANLHIICYTIKQEKLQLRPSIRYKL